MTPWLQLSIRLSSLECLGVSRFFQRPPSLAPLSLSFYFSFSSQAVKSSTDSFTNSLSLVPRFRPFLLRRSHQNVGNIVAPPLLSIPCRFSLERRLNSGQRLRKLGRRTSNSWQKRVHKLGSFGETALIVGKRAVYGV